MEKYIIKFHPDWEEYYSKLDFSIKKRVVKKISEIANNTHKRHLRFGLPHNVAEVGQYRICFLVNDADREVIFCFVGNHDQYQKWLRS